MNEIISNFINNFKANDLVHILLESGLSVTHPNFMKFKWEDGKIIFCSYDPISKSFGELTLEVDKIRFIQPLTREWLIYY